MTFMYGRPIQVTMDDLSRPRKLSASIADRIEVGDCWEWTGYRDQKGYGRVTLSSGPAGQNLPMHRVMWTLLVGPLQGGESLDHLCRNKGCCNPDHLEIIDIKTNILRGYNPPAMNARATHCLNGHEFSGDNLRYRNDGGRGCRICRRDRSRVKRANGKGDYFKTKTCPICGGEFQQKQQGTRPQTCGRHCGAVLRGRTIRAARGV